MSTSTPANQSRRANVNDLPRRVDLPMGTAPQPPGDWEELAEPVVLPAEVEGEEDRVKTHRQLRTIEQSLVLAQSLRQSRQTYLTSLFPKFSTRSRAKNAQEIVQPPHTIVPLGKVDIDVGPHVFGETKLFEVKWVETAGPVGGAAAGGAKKKGKEKEKAKASPAPRAVSTPRPMPQTPAPPPVSAPRPPPAPSSTTVDAHLVAQVNAAAALNPLLGQVLQLAAAGKATSDQLKALGAWIAAIKAAAPKPAPTAEPSTLGPSIAAAASPSPSVARPPSVSSSPAAPRSTASTSSTPGAASTPSKPTAPTAASTPAASSSKLPPPNLPRTPAPAAPGPSSSATAAPTATPLPSTSSATPSLPNAFPSSFPAFPPKPVRTPSAVVIEFRDNPQDRWILPMDRIIASRHGTPAFPEIRLSFFVPLKGSFLFPIPPSTSITDPTTATPTPATDTKKKTPAAPPPQSAHPPVHPVTLRLTGCPTTLWAAFERASIGVDVAKRKEELRELAKHVPPRGFLHYRIPVDEPLPSHLEDIFTDRFAPRPLHKALPAASGAPTPTTPAPTQIRTVPLSAHRRAASSASSTSPAPAAAQTPAPSTSKKRKASASASALAVLDSPAAEKKTKTKKRKVVNNVLPDGTRKVCVACGTQETPSWRRGPDGCLMCNRCQSRWKAGTLVWPPPPPIAGAGAGAGVEAEAAKAEPAAPGLAAEPQGGNAGGVKESQSGMGEKSEGLGTTAGGQKRSEQKDGAGGGELGAQEEKEKEKVKVKDVLIVDARRS